MAASKSTESKSAQGTVAPEGDPTLTKGELTGKVRGRDVDDSFHTYEFTDPQTGEPVEWTPVVHDVAVGVNSDGSLKTEKANETFAKGEGEGGASGGEGGERSTQAPVSTADKK
jgi:hypothetical protein